MNEILRIKEYVLNNALLLDVGCEQREGQLIANVLEYVPTDGKEFLCALDERTFSSTHDITQFVTDTVLPMVRKHYGFSDDYHTDARIECSPFDSVALPIFSNTTMGAIRQCVTAAIAVIGLHCAAEVYEYCGVRYFYKPTHDGVSITNVVVSALPTYWTLPDAIEGREVSEIAERGCAVNGDQGAAQVSTFRYVRLPKNIKRICAKAFWGVGRVKSLTYGHRIMHDGLVEFPETLTVLDKTAFGYTDYWYGCMRSSFAYYSWSDSQGFHSLDFRILFWGESPEFTSTDSDKWPNGDGLFGSHPNYGIIYVERDAYNDFISQEDWGYYISLSGGQVYKGFSRVNGIVNRINDSATKWSVALTCTNPDSMIFYTTDGSEPSTNETEICHLYTGDPIQLATPCYVKAIAYDSNLPYVKCETFSCSDGVVANVEVEGTKVFDKKGNAITLSCGTSDAVIRYTLDGLDVTEMSPRYVLPFVISDTTTVRARAFKKDWFDSDEVVQTFTRLWYTNETPVVSAAAGIFDTPSQNVSLTCKTEDATIYYTIDGSEPSVANGRVYKGPFDIYESTTVKAIAVKDDWKDSAVASATFKKANEIGPAINMLEVLPDNDKTHPWTAVNDVTHDGVRAVKSGEIKDDESTTLKVTVYGAGELSFWWKTSCEPSIDGEYYDYVTFYNGSTAVTNLAGVTDWQQVRLNVAGTGKHTFKWTYQKDDSNSMVPDGVWLDQVQWLPETSEYYSDHTLTTEAPVKYNWLRQYGLGVTTDFESAAKSMSGKYDGNGRAMTVEDEFVAGTDPTNETSLLMAMVDVSEGFPKVTWCPDLNEGGTKAVRTYKVWGKEDLDTSSEWEWPTNALHRFFRVTVEMP